MTQPTPDLVMVPRDPPDATCLLLSRKGWGFSVPERIDDGRRVYVEMLRTLTGAAGKQPS